ncbi:cell wall-binding protein [Gardnerella sp. Marseille-Q9181]|uniref:cell wall-binding protein n=1 Tax=Gardnerella sp. Marseille-Q9181 TaxID=3383029 RepID=UPI003AF4E4E3
MRSIWTVLLSVVVWVGRLAQQATKAALIFLISVAMWLPMCLTANTAVAAESDTASTVASSGNSDKKADVGKAAGKAGKAKSGDKAKSADNPNASSSADNAGADNANISAPSQPPVFVDGQSNAFAKMQMQNGVNNNLANSVAKGDGSVKGLIDSALMSAAEGMASQSGADGAFVNTDRASNNNRASNRNSKMEFRPGCYRQYSRSECITDDGDEMGHRASNGADMERGQNPWSTVYSNFASPQGRYTENDPNFTPYPRGTYLQKRLRNLPYDAGRNGVDPLAFNQLDDVHDYIFMKRTPKRDGKGYIWDVLVNMGARIHGAANALTYFVVPKDQRLDESNGQYDQYVERLHFDATKRTCSKDWVNPNGFCLDKGVLRAPLSNGETLDKAWYRLKNNTVISDAAVYNGGTQSNNENKNRGLGLCHTGYGFDCYHSTNYGFPSDGEHLTGTRLPPDGRQRFNQTYIDLIDHLYLEMRGPDSPEKSKIFTLTNNIENNQTSPYSYHIHYTTSDNGKYGALSTSYYGAGTYYGDKWGGPATRYGRSDPYGRSKPYSLWQWRGGKGHTDYEYTTLYQQWYGIPNLVDMRVPHFQFLRGTHLGPLTSNNGQLLAHTNNIGVTSLLFYPSQQRVCDKADESQCKGQVWAKGQISLSPKYNSADNKYARGNRWWRIPLDPNTNINTQDSSFGSHQMTVKYWNDKLQMGSSMPFKYDIIGQADVFRPLQTEEWNDNAKYRSPKTSLGKAENYVKYLDSKLGIYDFAIALNPRIYMPDAHTQKNIDNYDNYSDAEDSVYYGSIKDGKIPGDTHGLEYPLNDSYSDGGSGASKAIKDRAIYSVEWTDNTGNDKKSDTLQDAETKVAVKVPVVNVVNPCNGDDDKAADNAAEKNKDGQECQFRPLNDTKRYIWKLYDAPKGKSVDQALTSDEKARYAQLAKADFSKPVKEEYATPTNTNNENRIMLQSGANPEVKPVYVLAKYAKITYWDESKDVLPLVFTHVDGEKPTIDVKVSVDGGEPQSVPEGGLNVSVGSRVRFLVTGHDDMHVHMGTKENVPNINSTDVLEASRKWSGSFSKYDQNSKCGSTACANTLKDQSGYVTTNDPNGSPASANDVPSKEFTFHAWDDAGNNVQKTVKLNIIDGNFIVPNVRWQKQNDGKYVGKVTLSKNATSVKMLVVRIWGRGKTKPFEEEKDGTPTNIYKKCSDRSDGCQGIMLHREDEKHDWVQINSQNDTTFTKIMPYEKEITFNPKTGEITIPENLAEIGSRIYVGIGTDTGQINTSKHAVSQPLPLDMKWPDDGMVQVNPYELNPSEKQGLIERIKQKNPRLFDYRKDEIGWSKDETKTLGGKNDKYSCKDDKKQYKICLSVTPDGKNTGQNKSGSEKTFNVVKATGTGTDTQDDQKQETVLDPKQKKITRFVNIRADYDWSIRNGDKLPGRDSDDGFYWYGSDEYSTQYLVYKFNINQGNNFNTNDALSLFKGTKKTRRLGNQIQPSLYPLNTNDADATNKATIENLWGGYNSMPQRGDGGIGYARKVNGARGDWVNVVDLVKYDSLGGGLGINTNGITDKNSFLQPQGYIMPGGKEYNQQASGINLRSVILSKNSAVPERRTQLYIFNGKPWKDLEARDEGDKNQTPNVINVWFVPVDKNKPWISVKDPKDANKKLLGECNPTKDKADSCGTPTTIDMNKTDITKQSGLFNVVDLLGMDDDFNVANPDTHVSNALKNTLSIDIEADGVTDPKTKKAPRARFVTDGNINKELLRAFIEKWRGQDVKNSPTFKMIAQVTDDSGNKSNEAVVGKFKFNWTVADSPIVRAYDGHHYGDSSSSKVWLHDWEGAVANNYYNAVSVVAGKDATRLVVYFTRAEKAKLARLQSSNNLMSSLGAQDNLSSNNATSQSDSDTSEALALCRTKSTDNWQVCEGYTLPQGVTLNSKDEGRNNSAIIFNAGFLAPGSVVRARNHAGSYGPWSNMPGVKSENLDELSNNTNSSQSSGSINSDHASSSVDSTQTGGNESNALKEEDMRNVLSADSMVAQRSSVCRPETKAPKEWSSPSDCVFFPVVVNKKVVQVHPLLLNDSEKHAVNYVLRNGNSGGKWLGFGDADSLISVDDDDTLSANQSEVAWKRGEYVAPQEQADKRSNYSNAGNEQDSFILLRGWRRRNVTPEPRYNIVTRFATLRSVGNAAADYKITWDKNKPYVGERSDDPGFELVGASGHQSLVYRYNASTKNKQIDLNQLQNALTLKPNIPNSMSEDEFKKIQPSLRVVNGADKENGEHSSKVTVQLPDNKTRVDQFGHDDGSYFFTLNGEYINIPDLVLGNGNYGGGLNVSNTNGMNYSTLGNNYSNMSPQDITVNKWCEGSGTANPNCKTVNSDSFKLTKVLGGNKNIETADDVAGTSKKAIAPVYALSLSNGWAMRSLKNTYGYDAQTHFKNVASATSLIPVYVVPVDVVKPKAESIGSLKTSTMDKPYEVTANDINFAFTGNPDAKGKVNGKELLVNASDDFDSRDVVEKNLQVCVRKLNNRKPVDDTCTPILKRDAKGNASVDTEALQRLLITNRNTAVYAVYAQTKDKSDNESEHYDAGKDDKNAIIGYIKITGINVSPIPLPFTGGNAAITYTFLFGILMALFIASGAFGRRGWLASVLSGNGISGELTYSKHCNASAESLRNSRLFDWFSR